MKILLTGGLGYIGSHTALELLKANHDVIIIDNLSNSKTAVLDRLEKLTNLRPTFYQEDLLNFSALEKILNTQRPDAVIHFAGLKAVAESVEKPLYYYETNLVTTLNLLKAMESAGVNRLIFSSSATVYGTSPVGSTGLSEDAPTGQGITNPYGQTKYIIEQIIRDYASARNSQSSNPPFSATILRYFNPVGADPSGLLGEDPNGRPNNLMPIVARVYLGEIPELTVYGTDYPTSDGTCLRDFIHVSDLALGHLAALSHLSPGVSVYNLGTGRPTSVKEIVTAFETASKKKLPIVYGSRRPGDLPVLFANPKKAKRELNWAASRTLDDIVRDLLHSLKLAA